MTDINKYIYDLKYEPARILALPPTVEATKKNKADIVDGKFIVTTNTLCTVENGLYDIFALSSIGSAIYPGALVRGNQNLAANKPDSLSLPRKPLKVRIDLPGMVDDGAIVVQDPQATNVNASINELIGRWFKKYGEDYSIASRQTYNYTSVESDSQVALDLGVSVKWLNNDLKTFFQYDSSMKTSSIVAVYKQIYYTVYIDTPEMPSTLIDDTKEIQHIESIINNNNPPMYVQAVDYGRLLFIKMTSSYESDKSKLKNAMKFAIAGVDTEVTADAEIKNTLSNSSFSVISLGGNASCASELSESKDLAKLHDVIRKGANFNKSNPAVLMSYKTVFFQENRLGMISDSASYYETEYNEYRGGKVRFEHAGGYIAKFHAKWNEMYLDDQGNMAKASKNWDTGNVTSGYSYDLVFNGNCCDTEFWSEEKTGLVWEPWRRVFIEKPAVLPQNVTYRITGTTLSPKYNKAGE